MLYDVPIFKFLIGTAASVGLATTLTSLPTAAAMESAAGGSGLDSTRAVWLWVFSAFANELFSAFTDGVLLCRLINIAAPETIDERVVHLQR